MSENPLPELSNKPVIIDDICDGHLINVEVIQRPSFNDPEINIPAIRFVFDVYQEGQEPVPLSITANIAFGDRARMPKLVKSLTGPGFTDDVFADRDALWPHLQSLLGRKYKLVCKPTVSKGTGREYTNIESVTLVKGQVLKQPSKPISYEEDDVPF